MLFIGRFSFALDPVNDDGFCFIVYRIKNAVIACTDSMAFFCSEFFRAAGPWIGCKGKDRFVNSLPVFVRNLLCLFFRFACYYNLICQSFSQVLRNLSYGVKKAASRSALRRSLASSRSSSVPIKLSYSLRLSMTAFLRPFSSIRYLGFTASVMLCISYLSRPFLFNNSMYVARESTDGALC